MASTISTLPMKYALRGMGVPRSRLRVPRSRSMGIWMARLWNPVDSSPAAIMPVTKYWVNRTPGAICCLKMAPKITMSMTGNTIVNTTDSRPRRNCLISSPPRLAPRTSSLMPAAPSGRGRHKARAR